MATSSPILGDFVYTSDSVNRYTSISTNNVRTVLGAAPAASAVTVNSAPAARLGNLFSAPLTGDNANTPVRLTASVSDGATTETRHAWLPAAATPLQYDADGNLTHDGQWTYIWDAENRLVEMETTQAAVNAGRPHRRLTFACDWAGRRLARTVHGPGNTILSATRWLNHGWNPVAEFSAQTTGQTLVRAYLWGMDASGTMRGAGGVGGLLSVLEIPDTGNPTRHFPSYDGNGNIVAWTRSGAAAPVCRREYDPFGNVLVEHGAPPCGFGFSTKMEDPETGLLYYGHRYLSPPLGRWLGRDPIEEEGGLNLYGFVGNDGVCGIDPFGLEAVVPVFAKSRYLNRTGVEASQRALAETRKETSLDKQIEYCGSICCHTEGGSDMFFATGPIPGTTQSCPYYKAPCPKGSERRGWYHSHPDHDAAKWGENDFSEEDWGNVNGDEVAFLGEQSGVRKMSTERRTDHRGVEANLPKLVRIVNGREIPYEPWNNSLREKLGLPDHPDPRNRTRRSVRYSGSPQ